MPTPTRIFRVTKDELKSIIDTYRLSEADNKQLISKFLWKYWLKSFESGIFEITRIELLREASWARSSGFDGWAEFVSKWAKLAEPSV